MFSTYQISILKIKKFASNMGYVLPTAITLTRFSIPLVRYFSSQFPKSWTSDTKDSDGITPYKIIFSKELIKDLKNRLINTKALTPTFKNLENMKHKVDTDFLRNFINYWANHYNFQEGEKYINNYPHFMVNIQGLNIHYVHVKNSHPDRNYIIKPLLCLHGWPNSIIEFYNFIPLWTIPYPYSNTIYEMIIPSLPGFGFSSAPTKSGFSCVQMSTVLKNFMLKLGYKQFDIVCGHGSSFIARTMASFLQCNSFSISNMDKLIEREEFSSESMRQIPQQMTTIREFLTMTRCHHVHVARGDTLAIGLRDSPVALAAYILEKFLNNDARYIEMRYTIYPQGGYIINNYKRLIDNLMIYWASQSITTAMRVYAEHFID